MAGSHNVIIFILLSTQRARILPSSSSIQFSLYNAHFNESTLAVLLALTFERLHFAQHLRSLLSFSFGPLSAGLSDWRLRVCRLKSRHEVGRRCSQSKSQQFSALRYAHNQYLIWHHTANAHIKRFLSKSACVSDVGGVRKACRPKHWLHWQLSKAADKQAVQNLATI